MTRFEYDQQSARVPLDLDQLDNMGREGWELVTVTGYPDNTSKMGFEVHLLYIWKRPVTDNEAV